MKPKILSQTQLLGKLPKEVKIIFKIFDSEIRLVGGAVRDLLLQKKVSDFDFATKFLPQEIIKILEKNKIKAVPTGIKYGTITAVIKGRNFEITTLRKDNETDGRYCDPEFVDDFALDAARRDFTINALFLDAEGLVYDYFDGISDLKNKKVKFIGDANQRIKEDYLRILRFFRFSCKYGQKLDKEGLMACAGQRKNLQKLSKERIRSEFLKMLSCERQENLIAILEVFKDKKIADEIFKENLDIKALERLFEIEKKLKITSSLNLKLAVLFLGKDFDLKIFTKEISATNLEKKYFQFLSLNHSEPCIDYLKQLLTDFDKDLVTDLYLFFLAKENDLKEISEAKKTILFLQKFSLPDFPLSGEDLIQLGFKGKELGDSIIRAKKFWSKNDFNLSKKALIKFLQNF